jgi:hypothetical protein
MFGILISVATVADSQTLTLLFYRASTTSGLLAYVFLNMFAISMEESMKIRHGIWAAFTSFLIVMFTVWGFDPILEGTIAGTTEFTFTSMYKDPRGLPLIEVIIASMTLIAIYPVYLLFQISRATKNLAIRLRSLLMGIGIFIGTMAYAIEVTGAVSYEFMPIYRPMILVGSFVLYFGYMMPQSIQKKLLMRKRLGAELVNSFIKEFFQPQPSLNLKTCLNVFSKNIGLSHDQIQGRKILLEFDPTSFFEKVVEEYVTEAISNGEPVVVFTRKGSPVYSILSQKKAVKFFCLSRQISSPKILSEKEILLPSDNTPLFLSILDKLLKSRRHQKINLVFDSLSDLVLSVGFRETYKFTRSATEILSLPNVTAIFLLNPYAHDKEVRSGLSPLFSDQISFGKRGIEAVKLSQGMPAQIESAQGEG